MSVPPQEIGLCGLPDGSGRDRFEEHLTHVDSLVRTDRGKKRCSNL